MRPTSAPKSSRSTTGSSGAFAVRMNCHHERVPRNGLDSRTAVRKEKPSMTIAETRTTIGTQCHDSIGCGSCHLWYAS